MHRRFASVAVLGCVVVLGLVSACSEEAGSSDDDRQHAFRDCLRASGLSDEEIELFDPSSGEAERIIEGELSAHLVSLLVVRGECLLEAGLGESGHTPERIQQQTLAAIEFTACMRHRGWRDFPDPQPSVFGGLAPPGRIFGPDDPEALALFTADMNECSMATLGVPVEGADTGHDH